MDAFILIAGIMICIVVGAAHSFILSIKPSVPTNGMDDDMPKEKSTFTIRFSETQYSPALRVNTNDDAQLIIDSFGLMTPRPALFITGGAGKMTDDDITRTREIMNNGIAKFAEEHNLTVIDGGTEAGVMQMIGEARKKNNYKFPLIGCAPYYKVKYPGSEPIDGAEAALEDGHSHFVLVNSHEWGGESETIVKLTRAIAGRQRPMIGVLINGGTIAEKDVYYATAVGDNPIPILILDGSGRTADNISTAFKTQQTDSSMIKAIIQGGDIRLTPLSEGVPSLLKKLTKHFRDA